MDDGAEGNAFLPHPPRRRIRIKKHAENITYENLFSIFIFPGEFFMKNIAPIFPNYAIVSDSIDSKAFLIDSLTLSVAVPPADFLLSTILLTSRYS